MTRIGEGIGISVFCGSSVGVRGEYAAAAQTVGRMLGERGHTLVYGGGSLGLMGVIADAALEAGGEVIGVIPGFLTGRELAHERCTELIVVDSMHERKAAMAERSKAVLVLPGGVGTLDELFESITWNQIGIQNKPIGVLNVCGYFQLLDDLLDAAEFEGFVPANTRERMIFDDDPARLLDALASEGAMERPAS